MFRIGDVVKWGSPEVGVMTGDVRYFSDCGKFAWVKVAAGLFVRVETDKLIKVVL